MERRNKRHRITSTAPYTPSFKFDAKGQVVRDNHSTDNAKDRAFEFDGIGNRLKSADSLTLPASNNYVTNALNQYSTALGIARPVASHDDDGNLVDDGVKTYVWDGENRLLSVSDSSGVLVSYTYDYLSRRISKDETNGSNVTFVYDGWNPVAVYSSSVLSKTYTWGMDLSGSMQGAGGVGGLFAVKEASSGDSYYPTYDGNGNVSEYLDSSGVVVAHYEYDAFGRTTVSSGAKKDDFVHRFSTKQLDGIGLYYYGYRYYQPEVGRWLGRDPIEENGGVNIYGFVGNKAINAWDLLGMEAYFVVRREVRINFPKNVRVFYNPKDAIFGALNGDGAPTTEDWLKRKFGDEATFHPVTSLADFEREAAKLKGKKPFVHLDHGAIDETTGEVYPVIGKDQIITAEQWKKYIEIIESITIESYFCGCSLARGEDEFKPPGSKQNALRLAQLCEKGVTVHASNTTVRAGYDPLPGGGFVTTLQPFNLGEDAKWYKFNKEGIDFYKNHTRGMKGSYREFLDGKEYNSVKIIKWSK